MYSKAEQDAYHEGLKNLYCRNKDTTKCKYISDGIISFDDWSLPGNLKVLFILKEPNTGNEKYALWSLTDIYSEMATGKRDVNSYGDMMAKISFILNKKAKISEKSDYQAPEKVFVFPVLSYPGTSYTDRSAVESDLKRKRDRIVRQVTPHLPSNSAFLRCCRRSLKK